MLARVSLASGAEITTHQTFVRHDGSGQGAARQASAPFRRRRTHDRRRACGSAPPIPITNLSSAKGSRSTLSAMRIFGVSAGCAALSTFGICTLVLPPQVRRVRIFTDHDEHGQGLNAARDASRRWLGEGRAVAASISLRVGEDANDVWLRKRA